jgi:hypothetical protein
MQQDRLGAMRGACDSAFRRFELLERDEFRFDAAAAIDRFPLSPLFAGRGLGEGLFRQRDTRRVPRTPLA